VLVEFDLYFSQVFGEERWIPLRASLLAEPCKVARRNLFFDAQRWEQKSRDWVGPSYPELKHVYQLIEGVDYFNMDESLLPVYRMDPASIVAARALGVEPGQDVLDMCAAPGGKSLILAEDLFVTSGATEELSGGGESSPPPSIGRLVLNELSPKRRHRMMSVIKRYVPKEIRSRIDIRGEDASRLGLREKESYDRILIDAPCSGERGLMEKASELKAWKEKRSKNFSVRQYSLLASAFMCLKSGGRLVYSTCSISPHENDGVIAKLFKKRDKKGLGDFRVIQADHLTEVKTEFGYHYLPDQPFPGWGPIYFCIIEKL
jgi:5-methylcytosine rRNA methyltransferase NSUN4